MFHLQQLSQTTWTDAELSRDERYIALKGQIFSPDNMKALSPAQTVAACVALGKLGSKTRKEWTVVCNALKGTCEATNYRMSPSQVAVCLYWISKTGNAVCARDRLIETSFKHVLQDSNDWTPVDMGWLLYFMRVKAASDLPVWQRMVRQIAYRFNERLVHMSPRNVACILHEFSQLGLLPGKAIHRAIRVVDERKERMDGKTICLLLSAMAKLRIYKSDFVFELGSLLARKGGMLGDEKRMSMRQVSSVLYSFAKVDYAHLGVLSSVLRRIKTCDPAVDMSDSDLTQLAYGLGRLGVVSCTDEWKVLATQATVRVRNLSPLNVSVIVSAMGKAGFRDEALLASVVQMLRADCSGFTEQQLVNVLHGLANCGVHVQGLKLPKITPTRLNQFQLNKVSVGSGVEDASRPVMEPLVSQPIHSQVFEFLKRNSSAEDIELCRQTGSVWVDASFRSDVSDHVILILGDSDLCKLNPETLLGPAQWTVRYLKQLGYTVTTVRKPELVKAKDIGSIQALLQFIHSDDYQERRGPKFSRKPFHFSNESGKISFRASTSF